MILHGYIRHIRDILQLWVQSHIIQSQQYEMDGQMGLVTYNVSHRGGGRQMTGGREGFRQMLTIADEGK